MSRTPWPLTVKDFSPIIVAIVESFLEESDPIIAHLSPDLNWFGTFKVIL